ncbi:hypothetical protein CR513_53311, partial [Mucuna pruriens]
MTKSSSDPLYDLDLEIEITLRRLRKARNIVISNSSNSVSSSNNSNPVTNTYDSIEYSSINNFVVPELMENNDRTLKELATPDVAYQPWCIQYPQLEPTQIYELKYDLIHLRRSPQALEGIPCGLFHNEAARDTGRLHQDEGIPILPRWSSKDWLYLQPVLFNTWGDMKHMFLEKFFPASRTASIRKEICRIRQLTGETLHEYWKRFNKLCATCSYHQISEQLLIKYFYEGLKMMDRSMINAVSGGALMDKTSIVARHLISNMASNTQQFGIRGASQPRMMNEISAIDNLRLEN